MPRNDTTRREYDAHRALSEGRHVPTQGARRRRPRDEQPHWAVHAVIGAALGLGVVIGVASIGAVLLYVATN